jgi:hypothetical protein
MPGYEGPRCELCTGPKRSRFFNKLSARCQECKGTANRSVLVLCSVVLLLVLSVLFFLISSRERASKLSKKTLKKLIRWYSKGRKLYQKAGMRCKVKALVGVYQCVAAVPSVYGVTAPDDLDGFVAWMDILELPAEWDNLLMPTACVGTYRARLVIGSSVPIVILLVAAVSAIVRERLRDFNWRGSILVARRSKRALLEAAMRRILPLTLGVTFILVPSMSTRIFKTFLCNSYEFTRNLTAADHGLEESASTKMRYLKDDLALSCDSALYRSTRNTALACIVLWPVGVPLMYTMLLWASRKAHRTGAQTSLGRATAFLADDYHQSAFWWEPIEMCRKLALTVTPPGIPTAGCLRSQPIDSDCIHGRGRAGCCSLASHLSRRACLSPSFSASRSSA